MERFDVVVVGAGPAGSCAARAASEGGARTLIVDRRPEIGQPVQCGEFLPSVGELEDLLGWTGVADHGYAIPHETVERRTTEMVCVGPSGRRFRFPLDGLTVSRRAFDQALAARAERAGAELRHPLGVVRVRGSTVHFAGGATAEAAVVIGADGPLSTVARSLGFAVDRALYRMVTATAHGRFPPEIDLYFGSVAPGGYAWMIPKAGGANVGLGVTELAPGATLSGLLDRFARRQAMGELSERTRWWVPIGPPPATAVRGSALFCGDAANLVMATNGGGIPTAMISGHDAGTTAAAHVRDGAPLAGYDARWKAHLFAPLDRGYRIKRLADRIVHHDPLLALGMRYIGAAGLYEMMRLRWPARLWRNS